MLQELMADLWIAWQPIYNLRSGTIWGHEALIRGPKDSLFASPADLFELARTEEVEEPFEETCRKMAFEAAGKALRQPGLLFVNVNPRFLGLPIAPEQAPWPADHTIIEITEASPLFDDPEALQAQVATWRAQGYRIALDDFGAGFAGQAAVLALKPDVVKVDQRLVYGIDQDRWRQTIVAAMLHMCSDLGIATIAEGIETEAELEELVRLGVVMGQGYLLGRPDRTPKAERLSFVSLPAAADPLGEAARLAAASVEPGVAAHYAADHGRRIVSWDETAEAITGRKASEVIGLPCWLSGMDHRDLAGNRLCFEACPLVRSMQARVPLDSLVSLRDVDGERRWVTMHTEPVISPEGKVLGAVESFTLVARSADEAHLAHQHHSGHGRDASHHLFWRKEVARWLATWQNDEEFAHMAQRFVHALPFRAAAVWQPVQGNGPYAAIAMKGGTAGRGRTPTSTLAPAGGIVERAFRERRLIYLPGRAKEGESGHGVHLIAAIPLMHKGNVQGVLTLGDHEGDHLPVPAIEAIEEIAPLLGALMANQQLIGSLQQSRQVFSWMLETAPLALDYQPYLGSTDMQVPSAAAFRSFRRRWPEVAGVQGGVLLLRAETESREWLLHDVWGSLETRDLALAERWWPKARTFLVGPGAELPPDGPLPDDHVLAIPGHALHHYAMRDGRQDIASLLVDVPDGQVKNEMLLAVLEFTGLATVNRWRQRQLLRLARHDPLTGALNRRALEERLESYFKADPSGPALFLLLDLDDLKQVNDRFGHQAADDLLRDFTAYARAALRPSDEVARIGGDEFVWVLYEASMGEDTRHRLKRIFERSPLRGFGSGVTVGMVELPREAKSYAQAYRLADRRLYMGKHQGKGIIVDELTAGD